MRWLINFYDFRFNSTATAAIGIHPTKAWLSLLVTFKNAIWTWGHFRRTICNKIMFETWKKCHRNAWNASDWFSTILQQLLSGIRDSGKIGSLWGMGRGVWGVKKSINQSWLTKGLGLLCWGFKGVQDEISWEEASTLQIGSVAFPSGQYTSPLTPSLSQTIWNKMDIKTVPQPPYSPDPSTCDFGYSLNSEAIVRRQLRRWKRPWRRWLTRSHKRTSMGPSRSCWNSTTSAFQPEKITSKETRVSCVYYQ